MLTRVGSSGIFIMQIRWSWNEKGCKSKATICIIYPWNRSEEYDQDRILYVGETDEEANLRLNSLEYEVSDKLGGTSQNDYRLVFFTRKLDILGYIYNMQNTMYTDIKSG